MLMGSSDKDQALIKGRGKQKRKEYSDQDKAGELIFSFQIWLTIPQVFLVFVVIFGNVAM